MTPVFISYSHDSEEHCERVLGLSERLRPDGIETALDRYVNGSPAGGWPRWMMDQLDAAKFVLVVCTETYYRRFRGHEVPDKGKGADWEGALITQEIYDSKSKTVKFVPVLFDAADAKFIPEPLRSGSHYKITSTATYNELLDFLKGRAGIEPAPVGPLKPAARARGKPLTFDDATPAAAKSTDISHIDKYAPAELVGRGMRVMDNSSDLVMHGAANNTLQPRVYVSYTWRTPGLQQTVLRIADELRGAGIDSRIDLYYGKSLHGFTPPPPLPNRDAWDHWQQEQIHCADRIILFCTAEYASAPPNSGVARDLQYMESDAKVSQHGANKLIPVGLGPYSENVIFIPSIIIGATYYDLGSPQEGLYGLDDLIRRLKSEFPPKSATNSEIKSTAKSPVRDKPKGSDSMSSHQFNARRLHQLEELLDIEYEKAHEFEKEIALSDGASRITLRQRFKRDVLPELRKLEKEYAEMLVAGAPTSPMPDAGALVAELSETTATILQETPPGAPREMIRLLGEIKDKLSKPEESASAKLKISLPLIPAICSYEIEVETAGLMKKVWSKARDFFKGLLADRP